MVGSEVFENFSWGEIELVRFGVYKMRREYFRFYFKGWFIFSIFIFFRFIGNKEFL